MYLTMFGAFANLSELPVAAEARAVVTKQLDSSFYPTLPYIFSVIFLSVPLLIIETLIFGTLMYWLPGFVPEAGRYFFWLFLLFCGSLALSTFFRTISYEHTPTHTQRSPLALMPKEELFTHYPIVVLTGVPRAVVLLSAM